MDSSSRIILNLPADQRIAPAELFERAAPLEVDLGCGKGRFLSTHAARMPDVNFIGVDRLSHRVQKTEARIERLGLQNVRLIRIEAAYFIEFMLPDSILANLYVFYPDPWPKRRHQRRRLFSPTFMDSLVRVLAPGGVVHLATDHVDYFRQMTSLVEADKRFCQTDPYVPDEDERSEFEITFRRLGKQPNRLSFRLAAG